MDSEQLILLVFNRKALWDQKCKGYHNRDKSRKLWEEVANELNVSSETAKSKWKGLRDTFRKEFQKVKSKRSGDEGGEQGGSAWPYYASLYFLADQMTPRETVGNVPPVPNKNCGSSVSQERSEYEESVSSQMQDSNGNDQEDVTEIEFSSSTSNKSNQPAEEGTPSTSRMKAKSNQPAEEGTPSTSRMTTKSNQPAEEGTPSTSRMKAPQSNKTHSSDTSTRSLKSSNDIQKRMIELEEEKLQFCKQRKVETTVGKDYDYHFLMGLLPHLQNVKPERKSLVQLHLHQVLANEIMSYTQPIHHALPPQTFSGYSSTRTSYTPQPTPSPSLSESSLQPSYTSLSSPVSPSNSLPPHWHAAGTNIQDSQLDITAKEQTYTAASYFTNFQT